MKRGGKICLVVLCATVAVYSFFRPHPVVILLNFALAMFLLKKGWLAEAVGEQPKDGS